MTNQPKTSMLVIEGVSYSADLGYEDPDRSVGHPHPCFPFLLSHSSVSALQ